MVEAGREGKGVFLSSGTRAPGFRRAPAQAALLSGTRLALRVHPRCTPPTFPAAMASNRFFSRPK